MASGSVGAWVEGKPGTQPGSAAKRFGDNFFEIVHPIDGGAVCLAVQADSLAGFAKVVRRFLPEPENAATVTFLHVDKSSCVSRRLKLLKAVHSDLSMRYPVPLWSGERYEHFGQSWLVYASD
jgi:hypothetical protein